MAASTARNPCSLLATCSCMSVSARLGVAAVDRLQQRLVLALHPPVPGIGLGEKRHRIVQAHADLFDGVSQEPVAGGLGDRDVKVGVVAHVVGLAGGDSHSADRAAHRRQVGAAARACGDPGHGRLDHAPVEQEVLELFALPHHAEDQVVGGERVLVGPGDEGAAGAPAPRLDESGRLEQPQGVLDGRPPDAEHGGELAFRGQRLARLDQAERDVAADLLRHVLMGAQLVNPLEAQGRSC